MLDYSLILTTNYPNTQWILVGDAYEGLEWLSDSPKPTKAELDALWPSTQDAFAKQNCKKQASELLAKTDWSALHDVNLANKSDFVAYRAELRSLALNPVASPVWPTEPDPVWQ